MENDSDDHLVITEQLNHNKYGEASWVQTSDIKTLKIQKTVQQNVLLCADWLIWLHNVNKVRLARLTGSSKRHSQFSLNAVDQKNVSSLSKDHCRKNTYVENKIL